MDNNVNFNNTMYLTSFAHIKETNSTYLNNKFVYSKLA